MKPDQWLALAGIASCLLGAGWTAMSTFAATELLSDPAFAGGREHVIRVTAAAQRHSRPVPPYTLEEVRVAQKDVDFDTAERLMKAALERSAAWNLDRRKTARANFFGLLLVAIGSALQGYALLLSASGK